MQPLYRGMNLVGSSLQLSTPVHTTACTSCTCFASHTKCVGVLSTNAEQISSKLCCETGESLAAFTTSWRLSSCCRFSMSWLVSALLKTLILCMYTGNCGLQTHSGVMSWGEGNGLVGAVDLVTRYEVPIDEFSHCLAPTCTLLGLMLIPTFAPLNEQSTTRNKRASADKTRLNLLDMIFCSMTAFYLAITNLQLLNPSIKPYSHICSTHLTNQCSLIECGSFKISTPHLWSPLSSAVAVFNHQKPSKIVHHKY